MSYLSALKSKLGLTLKKEASDIRRDAVTGRQRKRDSDFFFLQCFTSLTPMNTCDPTVINESVSYIYLQTLRDNDVILIVFSLMERHTSLTQLSFRMCSLALISADSEQPDYLIPLLGSQPTHVSDAPIGPRCC